MESPIEFLKCSSATDPNKLATSIYAASNKKDEDITIRVIGAGALNQATKAVIISNAYFASQGIRVDIRPTFTTFKDESRGGDKGVTAINLKLLFNKI